MDPVQGITNPQLHNLYAYSVNNPMTYVDPFGLSILGAVFGGFIGAFVGALVFVVSGGNPLLAGLAGGFAGGSLFGGFNSESIEGAIIGGLFGAVLGVVSSAIVWGASWIGAVLQPTLGHAYHL
jgi:hypothetical protein